MHHVPCSFSPYCVGFSAPSNPRASGKPEVSCDQNHAQAVISPQKKQSCKLQKTIIVFHNDYFMVKLLLENIY